MSSLGYIRLRPAGERLKKHHCGFSRAATSEGGAVIGEKGASWCASAVDVALHSRSSNAYVVFAHVAEHKSEHDAVQTPVNPNLMLKLVEKLVTLLLATATVMWVAVASAQPGAESTELVRSIQMKLTVLGYQPGPVDGLVGPATTAAVRAFQRDQGLTETGELTEELVVQLETVVETHTASQPAGGSPGDWPPGPTSSEGEAGGVVSQQGAGDIDGDGLSNELELQIGTDPENADTDGDGMPDGTEIAQGRDALFAEPSQAVSEVDSDGDGLADHVELTLGTDPNNRDSDGDGIFDREDQETYGQLQYEENAQHEERVSERNETPSDLNAKIERWLETAERISALYAAIRGMKPEREDSMPSPTQESYPTQEPYSSVDSDRDGYLDDEEIAMGSDPNDPTSLPQYSSSWGVDSDRDGYPDEEELAAGSDPNNAASQPDYSPPPPPVTQTVAGEEPSSDPARFDALARGIAIRDVRVWDKLRTINTQLQESEGELDSNVSSSLQQEWKDINEQLERIRREMQK